MGTRSRPAAECRPTNNTSRSAAISPGFIWACVQPALSAGRSQGARHASADRPVATISAQGKEPNATNLYNLPSPGPKRDRLCDDPSRIVAGHCNSYRDNQVSPGTAPQEVSAGASGEGKGAGRYTSQLRPLGKFGI